MEQISQWIIQKPVQNVERIRIAIVTFYAQFVKISCYGQKLTWVLEVYGTAAV